MISIGQNAYGDPMGASSLQMKARLPARAGTSMDAMPKPQVEMAQPAHRASLGVLPGLNAPVSAIPSLAEYGSNPGALHQDSSIV